MSQRETVRKSSNTKSRAEEDLYLGSLKRWERIYLEEGAAAFMEERRGKKSAGRSEGAAR